tara:strand:+ start:112 stop:633 length:522 start_codon:yes stop_codon:yes gene_type:complete
MKKIKTIFRDVKIYQGKKFYDKRGFLEEVFLENIIKKKLVFSIVSKSHKNVLRGLHLQTTKKQDKFVTVLKGKIMDVIVDLRKNSRTFGKHYKIILSEKNCKFLFIPKGFAHGFLGLKKENIVLYSCSNYRNVKGEQTVKWDDENLKINWGIKKPILSKKDRNAQTLNKFLNK